MSYTFTPNTPIYSVRDEIDDVTAVQGGGVEGTNHFLSDERIQARLDAMANEMGNVPQSAIWLNVAASCLDTLATNQAYQLKVGQTQSEEFDGAKVADAIRKHAASLRARASSVLALAAEQGGTGTGAAQVSSSVAQVVGW